MTREEINQLLYCEHRAVDYDGKLNQIQMNDDDRKIMESWNESGYIEYGRIKLKDVKGTETHYVKLSEQAYINAHRYRMARAEQCWKNRKYSIVGDDCE